jgi:pre-mRNA 3'-end-processing factor FIP1
MGQQMYPNMEPTPTVPQGPSGGRGATPVPYRGRAQGRGRGFPARGRGRGGIYAGEGGTFNYLIPNSMFE